MFICSTVIYFGEESVGYDLYRRLDGFELMLPLSNTNDNVPKRIFVPDAHNAEYANDVVNEEIMTQVTKLITTQNLEGMLSKMTAAL